MEKKIVNMGNIFTILLALFIAFTTIMILREIHDTSSKVVYVDVEVRGNTMNSEDFQAMNEETVNELKSAGYADVQAVPQPLKDDDIVVISFTSPSKPKK